MTLLQCSLDAAIARACKVTLIPTHHTVARDQPCDAHAQCSKWSQLLHNRAKSLFTEHGARGRESVGWENLVGAFLLISPHQFSGEVWNRRAIECKQTCCDSCVFARNWRQNTRILHSLLWDGDRVREINASKWTAYTTISSLFSFQTLLKTKQNSNSPQPTMLGTNPKIGQIDLLRDVIVNKTRSLPSNTLKTHKLWK